MDARRLLADVVQQGLPSVTSDTPLQSIVGWDSLKMVRMVLRLEEFLSRELLEGELEGLHTVGDVEALLKAT